MPRPKRKKLDPKVLWVVTDSTRPITPTFYHEELARAVLKELAKDLEGLELRKDAVATDGTFLDAMKILSRENRWLDASARDKRYFQGLCEGWLTQSGATVPEPVQDVA